ncbi:PREDICTED: adhesion G protein-coupled receptor E4-like [Cyprinodon variegatus]|uniref:adhesion G protein-coupled receptor E4-like n=1 Tax=Cyprinodon variegatus TaxID=28743 RepID=UPI0007425B83|nr:PREDICTED: adhesion G protein-coupled receptor E4-like [Cyprinodon variegatus]
MTIIGERQQCEDICKTDETTCGNGTCHQGTSGHYCACSAGFTNYGNKKSRCSELDCGIFRDVNNLAENFHIVQDGVKLLSKRCLKLMENADVEDLNGEGLLESLLSIIDQILSTGFLTSSRKVSSFLDLVEQSLSFIGPFIKPPGTNRSTKQTGKTKDDWAFTITAVAQLCVLGTMWIFGCFQFEKGTIVMSYLFTILGSLQGVMLFVMHCLFSKQVREEYENILSRLCTPQKRAYSEFNFSHSSKANASRSSQDTGESHI